MDRVMRGGTREGAGRKPGKEQKRTVSFRFRERTIEQIREMRERGDDVTAMLESYIEREFTR